MGAEMPLDVLFQLFCATDITVNVLVAGLNVGFQAFLIRKMFHTAWFYTHCLHVVQAHCIREDNNQNLHVG